MGGNIISEIIQVKHSVEQVLETIDKEQFGLSTGINSLDKLTCGFLPNELIIVGGRPSMGKTAFAIGVALSIGRNYNVVYFTLEMSSQLILERLLVNESMVNYKALKSGMIKRNSEMWNRLVLASNNLKSYNINIDDSSVLSPFALERKLDTIAPQMGIDCVIIDYLQLMTDKRGESREVEVSDISRKLKGFAMSYKIPFVVLCQLNRRIAEDESNRPKMHHLRESGSIEQNADKILFVHRSDYERTSFDDSEKVGEAEIIVAKQRNGPIGSVEVQWLGECMRFIDKT